MNHKSHSITVHNIDPALYLLCQKKAQASGFSLNKFIKFTLAKSLDLPQPTNFNSFARFCGVWNAQEKQQFDQAIQELSQIDLSAWK